MDPEEASKLHVTAVYWVTPAELLATSHLHQPSKHSDAGINVIIFTSWQLIAALGEFREYTAEFLETGGNGTESVHYVRLFREFLTTLCFA